MTNQRLSGRRSRPPAGLGASGSTFAAIPSGTTSQAVAIAVTASPRRSQITASAGSGAEDVAAADARGQERDRAPQADAAVVEAPVAPDRLDGDEVGRRDDRGVGERHQHHEGGERNEALGPQQRHVDEGDRATCPGDEPARADAAVGERHQRRDGDDPHHDRKRQDHPEEIGRDAAMLEPDREERQVDADAAEACGVQRRKTRARSDRHGVHRGQPGEQRAGANRGEPLRKAKLRDLRYRSWP